jgi:hypothetical protein
VPFVLPWPDFADSLLEGRFLRLFWLRKYLILNLWEPAILSKGLVVKTYPIPEELFLCYQRRV